jgi:hypothetical protein
MDGDGVVDHVEAIGGLHQIEARARSSGPERSWVYPKCLAVVHSGIPQNRQLFNASICKHEWTDMLGGGGALFRSQGPLSSGDPAHNAAADGAMMSASIGNIGSGAHSGRGGSNGFSLEGGGAIEGQDGSTDSSNINTILGGLLRGSAQDQQQQSVQVAHPIVIQEPRTAGKTAKKRRFHSFFFLNNGLVSSFNHDGSRTWHTMTRASWMHSSVADQGRSALAAAFRPTLAAFALHADTPADHVLVVGERGAALLSLGGTVRAEIQLARDLATAKPIVADFNNDGVNDFIIVTTKG